MVDLALRSPPIGMYATESFSLIAPRWARIRFFAPRGACSLLEWRGRWQGRRERDLGGVSEPTTSGTNHKNYLNSNERHLLLTIVGIIVVIILVLLAIYLFQRVR